MIPKRIYLATFTYSTGCTKHQSRQDLFVLTMLACRIPWVNGLMKCFKPWLKPNTPTSKICLLLNGNLTVWLCLPIQAYSRTMMYIYTYIDTEDCIPRLSDFLLARDQTTKFRHYSPKAQTEAVKVVIHNNRIRFQDITVEQPRGIIMGMSPTPSLVNIYVAIHKVNELLKKCWALYFLPLPLYWWRLCRLASWRWSTSGWRQSETISRGR